MANATAPVEGKPILVIEGDLAKVTRTIVEKQVRTADLLDELGKLQPVRTGILPRGCILFSRLARERGQTTTVYAIERSAGMVSIRYKEGPSSSGQTEENIAELQLSWPFAQWFVKHTGPAISALYLTCTKQPVKDLDDKLFVLPMPNIYEAGHGSICLGNLVVPEGPGPAARTEQLIDTVMSSLWNHDLLPDYTALKLEGLQDRAQKSANDPNFGLTLDYQPHQTKSFGALVELLLGDTQ